MKRVFLNGKLTKKPLRHLVNSKSNRLFSDHAGSKYLPVTTLTETEEMFKDSIKKWATNSLAPNVKRMDEEG